MAQYLLLNDKGFIVSAFLDADILAQLQPLPYGHDLYFEEHRKSVLVPLVNIVFSRARPHGIVEANRLMRLAAQAATSRRGPISLKLLPSGQFLVLDGNSTALNGLFSGWPDIRCLVLDSNRPS